MFSASGQVGTNTTFFCKIFKLLNMSQPLNFGFGPCFNFSTIQLDLYSGLRKMRIKFAKY